MEKTYEENQAKTVQDKLSFNGVKSLSDTELLSVVLGRGEIKEQHIAKSKLILSKNITLDELFDDEKNVSAFHLSPGVFNLVKVMGEISNRIKGKNNKIEIINNNHDVEALMRPILSSAATEEFWVITLNRAARIVDKRCLSHGGTHSSIIDIKLMMKHIIETLASSVIIVHNHPSGNTEPSSEDIEITKKIESAAAFFDIKLLDHIIIGKDKSYSFREKGLL